MYAVQPSRTMQPPRSWQPQQRHFSMILLLVLLISLLLPYTQPRSRSEPQTPARPQIEPIAPPIAPYRVPAEFARKPEIVSLRNASSATFDLGNGTYGTFIENQPINYQDADGLWQPIQSVFTPSDAGWVNSANLIKTSTKAQNSSAHLLSHNVGIQWQPQAVVARATNQTATLATPLDTNQAQAGQRSTDGSLVRYLASWSNRAIHDQWRVGPGASEYTMRLNQRPNAAFAADTLDLDVKLRLFPGTQVQINGKPAKLPLETPGTLSFVDATGTTVDLAPPMVFEQTDSFIRTHGTYALDHGSTPDELSLRVKIPWAWLQSSQRSYPVIIDPLFQMRNGTAVRSPAHWNNYNAYIGDYGAGIGRFVDGNQHLEQSYLVKFAAPTTPMGAGVNPDTRITVTKASLIATPVSGGTGRDNWFKMNIFARVLNNDDWITANTINESSLAGTDLLPRDREIGWSGGDQEHPTSAIWDVTADVQNWFGSVFTDNRSFGIFSSNPFCPKINPNGCAGAGFSLERNWLDSDLAIVEKNPNPHQNVPSPNTNKTGGVRLVIEYTEPTINDTTEVYNQPAPSLNEPYYRTDHEYRLDPAMNSSVMLATRSLGATQQPSSQTTIIPADGQAPFTLNWQQGALKSTAAAYQPPDHLVHRLGVPATMLPLNSQVVVNASNVIPNDYQIDVVKPETPVTGSVQSVGDPASSAVNFTMQDQEMLKFWPIKLPVSNESINSRVDVTLTPYYNSGNIEPTEQQYLPTDDQLLAHFRANLAQTVLMPHPFGDPTALQLGDGVYSDNPSSDKRTHSFTGLGSGGTVGALYLSLSYDGPQVTTLACSTAGEFCSTYVKSELKYNVNIRTTSCRPTVDGQATYPTAQGTCQIVACPDANFDVAQNYHGAGNFGIWGAATQSGGVWKTTNVDRAPLLGVNNSNTVPTVAVVGGQITLDANGSTKILSDPAPTVMLIHCTSRTNPQPLSSDKVFTVLGRGMTNSNATLVANALAVEPWFNVWHSATTDLPAATRSQWLDVAQGRFINQSAFNLAAGNGAEVSAMNFNANWSVSYQGWNDLQNNLTPNGSIGGVIASMTLGNTADFAFDRVPNSNDKNAPRFFEAIRINAATITHKPELGGASKSIRALVYPRGKVEAAISPNQCQNDAQAPLSCIDLRAPDDTQAVPNRVWKMPDTHIELKAQSVVAQKAGIIEAYSADHPAMNQASGFDQQFSYDSFGARVSVTQEECAGSIVTVIKGEFSLTLPNVGDASDPSNLIAADFKLCAGSLRHVHVEFKSTEGIPIASTGLFLTGINGTVDIMPDYATIKIGIALQAAQGGGGGALKAEGTITIDTRGLIGFDGKAKILQTVDATGAVWVAWNPLDIGFDIKLSYQDWLSADTRGHLWKGQGWQHKYSWLPDDDQTHIAAQLTAEISIKEGQISSALIDIPPSDIQIGLELAFGQFCVNATCTMYEWGVKGAFTVAGYHIGLYYGFDEGFDFIFGNDNHVLIDQYGGTTPSPFARPDGIQSLDHRRAVARVNGEATEPFTINQTSEEAMITVAWRGNAIPTLSLISPNNTSYPLDLASTTTETGIYRRQSLYSVDAADGMQQLIVTMKRPANAQNWGGTWKLVLGNLSDDPFVDTYQILVLTNKGAPGDNFANDYSFTAPAAPFSAPDTTGAYTIKWQVPATVATESPSATISLFYTTASVTGTVGISVPIHYNLPLNAKQYVWDTHGLANGVYRIFGEINDGVNDLPASTNGIVAPDDVCQPKPTWVPPARAFDPKRFPGVGRFTAVGSVLINDTTPPPAPTGLALTAVESGMLAQWDGPTPTDRDTTSYKIQWGYYNIIPLPGHFDVIHEQLITANHTPTLRLGALNDVSIATQYAARVQAVDASGNASAFSPLIQVTPVSSDDEVPFKPQNFTVLNADSTSITLGWNENAIGAFAHDYHIVATQVTSSTMPFTPQRVELVVPDPNTSARNNGLQATITGLKTGVAYRFSIVARSANGWRSVGVSLAKAYIIAANTDDNGDGLRDDWANLYHLNGGNNADDDGDGLTNGEEYLFQTNPTLRDSDGDRFSDFEELRQKTVSLVADNTDPNNDLSYPYTQIQPRLELDRNRVTFRINQGEPSKTKEVVWSNPALNITTLQLSATSHASWLTALVTSNVITGEISLTADAAQLATGFYSTYVRVDSSDPKQPLVNGSQCIQVNLFVQGKVGGYKTYLPLLQTPAAQADLRGSITLVPDQTTFKAGEPVQIKVTITNNGTATTAPFWADLYINPSSPPTTANQPWYERCGLTPCFGMAWLVNTPIPPGGSITLSSTASSYSSGHTIWPGWFANGTTDLYLYVDSWNPGNPNGAVSESNETNNVFAVHNLNVTGTNPQFRSSLSIEQIQSR